MEVLDEENFNENKGRRQNLGASLKGYQFFIKSNYAILVSKHKDRFSRQLFGDTKSAESCFLFQSKMKKEASSEAETIRCKKFQLKFRTSVEIPTIKIPRKN